MRKTKEEAQATRENLLDAAERMFFERGVSRTSLEHVAAAAQVTRGAVYWHFKNKADLFNSMVDRVRLPMEQAFFDVIGPGHTLDDLEAHFIRSFQEVSKRARLRRVYTTLFLKLEHTDDTADLLERERAVRTRILASLEQMFARLQSTGEVAGDEEPRILALQVYAFISGLYTDYLRTPDNYKVPQDIEKMVEHFFKGFRMSGPCPS